MAPYNSNSSAALDDTSSLETSSTYRYYYDLLAATVQQVSRLLVSQPPPTNNNKLTPATPSSTPTVSCPFLRHQHAASAVTADQKQQQSRTKAGEPAATTCSLPYSSLPSPKGLPIVGTLFDLLRSGAAPMIHEYCDRRHKELGPLYRETMGSVDAVFVADAALLQKVYANEGRYPQHLVPEPWLIYNEVTGCKRGLFFMDGPLWRERRRSLNRVFLKRSAIAENVEAFNEITADLIQRWTNIRDQDEDHVLPELEKELYKWSIECLGHFIFGRRMGCVSLDTNNQNDEIYTFVQCVQQIFTESARMTTIPPRLAYALNLPVWRRFSDAVGSALTIARSLVEDKVREIVAKEESGEPVEGMLAQLLLQDNIEEEELIRIVTDLFLAAADTTSHSTQWALHLLAQNPECQRRLRQEIDSVAPNGQHVTMTTLSQLPYARAIVKEALRLYPVAPFLTRILTKDLVLGGYNIPSGKLVLMSQYTMGRDAKYFRNPTEFLPERWLNQDETISAHVCLPFGLGSRGCIGRRFAEAQMHLLLAKVVQKFDLSPANENEVTIRMRMVTAPSEPILIRLMDRTTAIRRTIQDDAEDDKQL